MSSLSITERAAAVLKAEAVAQLAAERAALSAAVSAAAERDRLEREARIIAAAERQQALLRAERLEAEQAAAAQAASEQAAISAEVERLRARTPLEVMQDEMAEMKRLLAAFSRPPEPEAVHLRERVLELDTLYKSSRQETAALQDELVALRATVAPALVEIKELKKSMLALADAFRWSTMICQRGEAPRGVFGPTQWGCDTAQAMRASDSTLPPRPEDRSWP